MKVLSIIVLLAGVAFSLFGYFYADYILLVTETALPKVVQPSKPLESEIDYRTLAILLENLWVSNNAAIKEAHESVSAMYSVVVALVGYSLVLTSACIYKLVKCSNKRNHSDRI